MSNVLTEEIYEGAYEYIKNEYVTGDESEVEFDQDDFERLTSKIYEGMFKELRNKDKKSISRNLGNLFIYGLDYVEDEEAVDKQGNYVPWIKAGKTVLDIFGIDSDEADLKDKDQEDLINRIIKKGKINLVSSDSEDATSINTIVFATLEARIITLCRLIKKVLDDGTDEFIVDEGGFITFKAVKEDDDIELLLTPGPLAKMNVKDDEATEDEE